MMKLVKSFLVLVLLAALVTAPSVSAFEINPEDKTVITSVGVTYGIDDIDLLYDGCSSFMDDAREALLAMQE